ncbi:MAG: hypothetical protein WCP97_05275 [bacterium]
MEQTLQIQSSSIFRATVSGAIAAIVGMFLWMVIPLLTKLQVSYTAIVIGVFVGIVVRVAGRSTSRVFGCLAAGFSLLSCMGGYLLTGIALGAIKHGKPFFTYARSLSFSTHVSFISATFTRPTSLLFYGLAIYLAYFTVVRHKKVVQ